MGNKIKISSWSRTGTLLTTNGQKLSLNYHQMGRAKRLWYLLPMRAAKVQASLRIRAVSPEPSLLAHTSSESRGTFRQKARSLAPLNGWACAVEICHDGMLEDTNSLDGAQITSLSVPLSSKVYLQLLNGLKVYILTFINSFNINVLFSK